jgi:hypothetical protein
MTMPYNMMIGYDIYDCFTMEHFRLRQRMILTTKIYCSRLYIIVIFEMFEYFVTTYYQRTFPWELSKIPKFNLTAENFPKTTHQDKE